MRFAFSALARTAVPNGTRPAWVAQRLYADANISGSLRLMKWLSRSMRMTVDELVTDGNYAMQTAAFNGHLHIVRWIDTMSNITAHIVNHGRSNPFKWACNNDYLRVAKWLYYRYGASNDMIMSARTVALKYSQTDMLAWLNTLLPRGN